VGSKKGNLVRAKARFLLFPVCGVVKWEPCVQRGPLLGRNFLLSKKIVFEKEQRKRHGTASAETEPIYQFFMLNISLHYM
jgi:hypothetical protein